MQGRFRDIVRDRDGLYLRAVTSLPLGSNRLTVVTSEPFDKSLVANIAADLGEITVFPSGVTLDEGRAQSASAASVTPQKSSGENAAKEGATAQSDPLVSQPFTVGSIPSPASTFDLEIPLAGTSLSVVDWNRGCIVLAALSESSRFAA